MSLLVYQELFGEQGFSIKDLEVKRGVIASRNADKAVQGRVMYRASMLLEFTL